MTTSRPLPSLEAARRRRGPECASDLLLDRLALGELAEAERHRLEGHLAACAACASAGAALAADRARFLAEANVGALAADALSRVAGRPRGLRALLARLALPVTLAAGAAAALALWARPEATTRTKGSPFSLALYVLHEGATGGVVHGGEPLHPGDRLQFRYNGEAGHLAVVSIDAEAKVSLYYPPGPEAEAIPSGHDVPLRSAVELDGTLGPELLIAVRCARPVPVARILEAAQRSLERARAAGVAPVEVGPLDLPCDEARHRLSKAPRPDR